MDLLTQLTPAETLLLIKPAEVTLKELMKVTLMDLLRKQVLQVEMVESQPHPKDPVTTYPYVTVGANWAKVPLHRHEHVYLKLFLADSTSRVLFRHLIKAAVETVRTRKQFSRYLISGLSLQPFIRINWWQSLTGGFSLNEYGQRMSERVRAHLSLIEAQLSQAGMRQPELLRHYVQQIGGIIFLLGSASFAYKLLVEEVLSEELERRLAETDGGFGADVIFSSGDLFDPDSSDGSSFDSCFDSAADSGSSGSDGGDGGDGGGDSGCGGGCSGCGGGGD